MQISGMLKKTAQSLKQRVRYPVQRISIYLPVVTVSSFFVTDSSVQNAYGHVSHVLTTQQYATIKMSYPDIEILATIGTGLMVVIAIFVHGIRYKKRSKIKC
ncbi:MAG: hypothetical protein OEW78_08375 [Nitrosopumilus sp.]|uniref:hypothetical protein n=1 Tax=Nitrosopumilus sp. TaxID=2024843 RepID=UPI00246AB21D|nr:hypothetical protein [Nitrosopumilus sp.]MDH5431877.1 hypothetical protein [Nitrosopumilus sp.]